VASGLAERSRWDRVFERELEEIEAIRRPAASPALHSP
jgi:hypothetical protein